VTSIIQARDVAYPTFQAPDLAEMETFLQAFGMRTIRHDEQVLTMSGTDGTVVHETRSGPAAFVGLAFAADRDELALLSAATGIPVEPREGPGGGCVVQLTDPDGRAVDIVADMGTEPHPVLGHATVNVGTTRVRVDELQRVPTGPSQVKRFGHAALKTPSLATLAQWYAETLGLVVSDDLYLGEPGQTVGRFMRCDRGAEPSDHHSLLIIETGEVRLGHCAWEVADFDDLMAGHTHLLVDGRRHYWGVGRHVLGGQVFDYWKDPLGFTVEHWTDSDLLTAAVPPGERSLLDPINQWGPNPPDDLDF
jgi:catechol 2,3-dioxygenase-like lactoylglutathione lyase family enzyme